MRYEAGGPLKQSPNAADITLLIFAVLLILGGAGSLFLPEVRHGDAERGILGALGLPLWVLSVGAMLIGAAAILVGAINYFRVRRGKPPL